ncbi:MAG: hypothetical protein LBS69_11565 [Prevotellaceae bacterium]|jgi:hypothetical protein|nr:hypothetical protein [Prevotellaceae bacterium]
MKKIYLIQILLLSIFLAGCDSTEYLEFENTQVKIESANVNFSALGGTGEIVVAESNNFTATVDQTWCSLNVSGNVISVTAIPNMSISGRNARITVKSGNKVNYVSVTQASITFKTETDNATIDGKGGEARIAYETEASLAIDTVTGSWLTASIDGNEIVLQAANANPSISNTRSATVTLAIQNQGTTLFTYDISVTQEKNYLVYEDYLGTYTMYYTTTNTSPTPTKSLTVTLSAKVEGESYKLEGILAPAFDTNHVTVNYNANGTVSILGQIMFKYPSTTWDTWFLPYSKPTPNGNYVNRSTTVGMVSADIDLSSGNLKFSMVDNGVWGTPYEVAGFLIRVYDVSTNMGNLAGADGQPYYFFPSFEKQ